MIGFSASFVKTISILLKELRKEKKEILYIFSTIINHCEDGEYYFDFPYPTFVELNKILDYNGFDVQIIKQVDDIVTFAVRW